MREYEALDIKVGGWGGLCVQHLNILMERVTDVKKFNITYPSLSASLPPSLPPSFPLSLSTSLTSPFPPSQVIDVIRRDILSVSTQAPRKFLENLTSILNRGSIHAAADQLEGMLSF